MANKRYNSGRNLEYKIIKFLTSRGYYCIRSAGSHGAIDILAGNGLELLAIQAKKDKSRVRKKEKIRLKEAARLMKARAVIVDSSLEFCYDF